MAVKITARSIARFWIWFALAVMPTLVSMTILRMPSQAQEEDSSQSGSGSGVPQAAPFSVEFEQYLRDLQAGKIDASNGYFPSAVDLSYLESSPRMMTLLTAEPLPAVFDWRTQNKVTPVKNQGSAGTCWIFGTLASLESRIDIIDNREYDLSEQNLITGVDQSWTYLTLPPYRADAGGNIFTSTDTLTRKGTRLESTQPYNPSTIDTEPYNDSTPVIQRVTDFRMVTDFAVDSAAIEKVKNAIYDYGPVAAAYYENGQPHPNNIYYLPNCTTNVTHMVSLLGWDDTIAHPADGGHGAWIVKNSWGSTWGDHGFFYLCYGSANLRQIGSFHGENGRAGYEICNTGEHIYSWDEAGNVTHIGYNDHDSAWMRSKYTATKSGILTSVDFWTTANDAQYQIYVYSNSGALLRSQSGTCAELGYYTIPLTNPLALAQGQQIRIDVQMTTTGYNYPLAGEVVISNYCTPPIQSGVTYIKQSSSDSWDDTANHQWNICLRATVQEGVVTEPANNITNTSATFHGELFGLNEDSSVQVAFDYGTDGTYGSTTETRTMTSTGTFDINVNGLNPNLPYYFRAKALEKGTAYAFGGEQTFAMRNTSMPLQLNVTVELQGDGRPVSGWNVPLTVKLFSPGADVLHDFPMYNFELTTAKSGEAAMVTIPSVYPGTYDISTVSPHSLTGVKRGVAISGASFAVDLGQLLEGNANGDNSINAADMQVLLDAFGNRSGQAAYDDMADFDMNGIVDISDFGIIAGNYSRTAPVVMP